MSHSTARRTHEAISLFPFLAVLICTMGALIVLLVLVMEQARRAATSPPPAQAGEDPHLEELRLQQQDQQWRVQVLQEQRDQLLAELSQRREYLTHVEKHIRELETNLRRLHQEAQRLDELAKQSGADMQSVHARRVQLEEAIAAAKASVEEAKQQAARRQASYAIIPYPGPNGTTRRPIYVECTGDSVILRPENVILRLDDFSEPLTPGNPFDAALRAAAKYLDQTVPMPNSQPYPLLIVRPDGIVAYALARRAMASWEDEFGYELIPSDMVLHFPDADPHLTQELQRAVHEARLRQAALRRAMPSRARSAGFVVGTRGGMIPIDGSRSTASSASRSGASTTGSSSTSQRESQTQTAEPTQSALSGTSSTTASASGAPGGTQSFGSPIASLADRRGKDWAIPPHHATQTAYRRPVRVVCQKEALVLMPEAGQNDPPQVFPFHGDMTATVDQFVAALRTRISSWGLAPLGGYWKPQLIADVAPDAQPQYALLEALLEDSGIDLQRNVP
jgi:hypothetical protein